MMGEEISLDFPDSITPVYGFRAWRVKIGPKGINFPLMLSNISPTSDRRVWWSSDGWTWASCHNPIGGMWAGQRRCPGPVPNLHCECGLYAFHDAARIACWQGQMLVGAVIGQGMSEWGVIRHQDDGWRAEQAKPIAFVKPRTHSNPLPKPPPSTYRYYDQLDPCVTGMVEQLAYRIGARMFDTIEDMREWVVYDSPYESFYPE